MHSFLCFLFFFIVCYCSPVIDYKRLINSHGVFPLSCYKMTRAEQFCCYISQLYLSRSDILGINSFYSQLRHSQMKNKFARIFFLLFPCQHKYLFGCNFLGDGRKLQLKKHHNKVGNLLKV